MSNFDASDARKQTMTKAELKAATIMYRRGIDAAISTSLLEAVYVQHMVPEIKSAAERGSRSCTFEPGLHGYKGRDDLNQPDWYRVILNACPKPDERIEGEVVVRETFSIIADKLVSYLRGKSFRSQVLTAGTNWDGTGREEPYAIQVSW